MTSEAYANKYLSQDLADIQRTGKHTFHPELSIYEKAIIYKYSSPDGYLEVNMKLRASKGKNATNFGKLLAQSLERLSNYNSVVYRKVYLTKAQQNIYKKALKNGTSVREYSFISSSKVRTIATLMPGNTLFIINSKTGKDIEKIAKFGYGSSYNEYEVLFQPNRQFEVLEVDDSIKNLLTITMQEV